MHHKNYVLIIIPVLVLVGLVLIAISLVLAHSQPLQADNLTTPAIELSCTPNPATFGQPVTLSAQVSGGTTNPTGTVLFRDNNTQIASQVPLNQSGQAVMTITSLTAGTHQITAAYSGDNVYSAGLSPARSQVVNKTSTICTINPQSNSVCGQPVTFTITVNAVTPGSGVPAGTLQLRIDGTVSGNALTLTAGSASSGAVSYLTVGLHTISAIYSGDTNFSGSNSNEYSHTVTKANTSTTISSNAPNATISQSVTITALVARQTPSVGTPAGSVKFTIDGIEDNNTHVLDSNGSATLVLSPTLGSHTLSAAYSGNSENNASASTVLNQTVSSEPVVLTMVLSQGIQYLNYSQALEGSGGTPPYTWKRASGVMPSGLILNADGTISGSPASTGKFSFSVKMTDANNFAASNRTLTITILGANYAYAWGRNDSGQLGNIYSSFNMVPVAVNADSLGTAAWISAGSNHSLAIDAGGEVFAWGNNGYGQLGTGNTANKSVPTHINKSGFENIVMVSAGYQHSLALQSNGTVWTWGNNDYGQLGNNSSNTSLTPVALTSLPDNIIAVSAGNNFSLALTSDGYIWAWGDNQYGQLGTGSTTSSPFPVKVYYNDQSDYRGDFIAISAGGYHSLGLTSSSTVWTFGGNQSGQLGDNTLVNKFNPVPVQRSEGGTLSDIIAISAGLDFNLALSSSFNVWAWGNNNGGQLGNNSVTNSSMAVTVKTSSGTLLTNVNTVAAGNTHSLVLRSDKSIWAWGSNAYGQLGTTNNTSSTYATQVMSSNGTVFMNSTAISAGGYHSIALNSSDTTTVHISSTSLAEGNQGVLYNQTLSASGGSGSYIWYLYSGTLPTGLTLNSTTGNIYGTPTQAGSYTFTIKVTDSLNNSLNDTTQYTVNIVTNNIVSVKIATSVLSNAKVNQPYNQALNASGGSGSYNWYLYAGSLPPGLALNILSGAITGNPTNQGSFTFSIKVVDNNDIGLSDVVVFTILVLVDNSPASVQLYGLSPNTNLVLDTSGSVINSCVMTTTDTGLRLGINAGTNLLDSSGKPLTMLQASILTSIPAAQSGTIIIGGYTLTPEGAIFSPSISMIFKYTASRLPFRVDQNSLYIALHNGNQWTKVNSLLNIQEGTVTAQITHFSVYALVGILSQTQTTTTSLTTINTLTSTAPYVTTGNPGTTQTSLSTPATITVTRTVTPAPSPKTGSSTWLLVIGIIGGVLLILIIIFVIAQRNRQFH
jgi:alpha-tubulin suppressor-like RCC1 family protein